MTGQSGPSFGTCENPRHDSKPQEWHEENATCIDWHPGPDRYPQERSSAFIDLLREWGEL